MNRAGRDAWRLLCVQSEKDLQSSSFLNEFLQEMEEEKRDDFVEGLMELVGMSLAEVRVFLRPDGYVFSDIALRKGKQDSKIKSGGEEETEEA